MRLRNDLSLCDPHIILLNTLCQISLTDHEGFWRGCEEEGNEAIGCGG